MSKQEKWVDVINEFEFKFKSFSSGGWFYAGLYNKNDPSDNDPIYFMPTHGKIDEYEIEKEGNVFRILRRVEEPVFKWTKESVAAIDWSSKSTVETLEASAEHWRERIEHFDVSGEEWWGSYYCPACKKWRISSACPDCPLDCGKAWSSFYDSCTAPNALAVLSHIEQKLEEARQAEKCKKWEPKLGDRVRHSTAGGGFVVVGIEDSGEFRELGTWKPAPIVNGNNFLLFNPQYTLGNTGEGEIHLTCGGRVAGYPHAHMWARAFSLTPEDSK